MRSSNKPSEQSDRRRRTWRWWSVGCCVALILVGSRLVFAQQVGLSENGIQTGHDLQRRVEQLEAEVTELRKLIQEKNSSTPHQLETPPSAGWVPASAIPSAIALSSTEGHQQEPGAPPSASLGGEDRKTLDILRKTTINLGIDGYYAYNFNRPVARVRIRQVLFLSVLLIFLRDIVSVAAWTCNSAKRRIPCLFSALTQALKETTATLDYKLDDAFLMRYEWCRDFSNQRSFWTDTQGVLSKQQNTASVGLVWWWGRKEGTW